jgi:hypothetical protein
MRSLKIWNLLQQQAFQVSKELLPRLLIRRRDYHGKREHKRKTVKKFNVHRLATVSWEYKQKREKKSKRDWD